MNAAIYTGGENDQLQQSIQTQQNDDVEEINER